MDFKEWADLLPVIQSVLNYAASAQSKNIAPVTAFLGMGPTPLVATFLRTTEAKPITVTAAQLERCVNVKTPGKTRQPSPKVHSSSQCNRMISRSKALKGKLTNFEKGDFVLVAREEFFNGKKPALRWSGPRRIVQVLSNYVFQVEDLRKGMLEEAYGTRLKFYRDASLDTEAIMSPVLASETGIGMPVARQLKMVVEKDDLFVHVRWKDLSESQDTLEPFARIYEDVSEMAAKLQRGKNTPSHLAERAKKKLGL